MNQLAHFAINADDVPRARRFYESVFGWTLSAWGPPDFYQIDTGGDGPRGALQKRRALAESERTVGFECTIAVESIDAIEQAVLSAGGSVVMKRSVIEGVGTLMFFRDTEGNVFGAMQYVARG
ncbi:MAG: VOC family protein [Sandaracinaceae bacterium]